MPIIIIGIVEDVQSFQGKNGFGANITLSAMIDKRRKSLTFMTKDMGIAQTFEKNLQKEVTVKMELAQSSFGLRLGDIYDLVPSKEVKETK